jgi:hypothetical protein
MSAFQFPLHTHSVIYEVSSPPHCRVLIPDSKCHCCLNARIHPNVVQYNLQHLQRKRFLDIEESHYNEVKEGMFDATR